MSFKSFKIYFIPAIIFIGLPLLFWVLGDLPRRTVLKETLSVLTILAFFMLLGQFFLSRNYRSLLENLRFSQIMKVHKYIGYTAAVIILLHPFLIVFPRYFESGVSPVDAFLTLITTFDSLGVILGLVVWILLLTLILTTFFQKKLGMHYRSWKVFHGVLSVAFMILATWHAIDLGRHTDRTMSIYMVVIAGSGLIPIFKSYILKPKKSTAGK